MAEETVTINITSSEAHSTPFTVNDKTIAETETLDDPTVDQDFSGDTASLSTPTQTYVNPFTVNDKTIAQEQLFDEQDIDTFFVGQIIITETIGFDIQRGFRIIDKNAFPIIFGTRANSNPVIFSTKTNGDPVKLNSISGFDALISDEATIVEEQNSDAEIERPAVTTSQVYSALTFDGTLGQTSTVSGASVELLLDTTLIVTKPSLSVGVSIIAPTIITT